MHVVLRSQCSLLRLKKNRKVISDLLSQYSNRFNIRIYQNSLNSNHIHLVCLAKERRHLQNFLRVFAGQVAQCITGCKKGNALNIPFWSKIAWSRIVEWGRAFKIAINYVMQNQMEALGIIPYTPRKTKPRILRI